MNLKIILPSGQFLSKSSVSRIVADTSCGLLGILPHRLDFVASLVPGVLLYQIEGEGERFVAMDEGIMVKTGHDLLVSAHRAMEESDLSQLKQIVEHEFRKQKELEDHFRSIVMKIESGFIRRYAELTNE